MPSTSPINPPDPYKAVVSANPKTKATPSNALKVDNLIKKGNQFAEPSLSRSPLFKVSVGVPQNTFLGLADMLEIDHSEKMMGFLKDYTDKEFIDEINAFKHLPIVGIALNKIAQNFKKWDSTHDPLKLEETLTNQFKNLSLLIDILTDLLPEAGEKIIDLRETHEIDRFLDGDEPIGDEMAFKILDHFRSQLKHESKPN